MDFSSALNSLKEGKYVHRTGWNGRNMCLFMVKNFDNSFAPFIAIKMPNDQLVPWVVSQTDLMAEDWQIKE